MNFRMHPLLSIGVVSLYSIFYLLAPLASAAITPGTIPTGQDIGIREPSPANSVSNLVSILASLVRWVYVVFFIVTVLYILLAAYNYLTAAGENAKIELAHKEMKWAAVAITVAFLSVGAELIIKDFLTNKPPGTKESSDQPLNVSCNPGESFAQCNQRIYGTSGGPGNTQFPNFNNTPGSNINLPNVQFTPSSTRR